MPLTHSEILNLVDEVDVAVAQIIASYAELKEGFMDDAATDAVKRKLERLKGQTVIAKQRLADLKRRQRHKREMEKKRKERAADRGKNR